MNSGGSEPPVLVVEDDPVIGGQLRIALSAAGYGVRLAATAARAQQLALQVDFRMVLLDLGLPDLDGFELCRTLRARLPRAVIVVLTARHDEIDIVAGLESGADDYLLKPFRLMELLARVRAHLRRDQALVAVEPALQVDDLQVDLSSRIARIGPAELLLRPREFDLLARFASDPGVALRREELLEDVWDRNWDGSSKTLDVHVLALRRKLSSAPPGCRVPSISTIRGYGYRLDAGPGPGALH